MTTIILVIICWLGFGYQYLAALHKEVAKKSGPIGRFFTLLFWPIMVVFKTFDNNNWL